MSDPEDPRAKLRRPTERPNLNLPARRPGGGRPQLGKLKEEEPPPPPPQPNPLSRLLEAIVKLLEPLLQPKPQPDPNQTPAIPAAPAEPPVLTVLVAAMNGDSPDGAASQALYKLLNAKSALKVKPVPRPFQLDKPDDPTQMSAVVTNTRHLVTEEKADLLVWGDVVKEGYRLRISTGGMPDDERPTLFGPMTKVELALNLDEPQQNMLYAALLAAADPANQVQRAALRRLLPLAVLPLEAVAAKPPVAWSMPQQRSAQVLYGHVCAACALAVPPSQSAEWFQKAINAYNAAEKRLNPRTDPTWEAGLIAKYLAAVLTARGERLKERAPEILEEAVKKWRAAAENFSKATMPQEWAATQMRLGNTLYRLDLLTGDSELLRESLQCLQAALQVHTRADAPMRWADIMHTIAQVLEVYGDQLRSPEVLKRAIDACNSVLEVRVRERQPLAWAATRNTLGSALFLLDRHNRKGDHLEQAGEVLEEALQVFITHGAKGPAQVAARNLGHVRKMIEDRKTRQVIDPGWD